MLEGEGWTFSLQRLAVVPAPGMSANLGAATMVDLGFRDGAHFLAARAAPGERLWTAVAAPRNISVEARLADGRGVIDDPLGDESDPEIAHRFARIQGSEQNGIDRSDTETFRVTIGDRQLDIAIVEAEMFDARYGIVTESAPESVYGGWRLP